MLKEFKEFLMRGNVVDLAVAVIIGGAFGAIVTSLVNDIFMPIIGIIFNASSLTAIVWHIGAAEVKIGAFIAAIINFVIIGAVLFAVVKAIAAAQNLKKVEETEEVVAEVPTAEQYLREIRDLLKNK